MGVTKPSVVFFGSGPVAAASLELLSKWATVEAVVTKPQPPHHKEPFPVLVLAQKLGLKTYTPNSKAELSELVATKPFTSRLGVVIDYGFIINQDVIDSFELGIVNSHFSLLPEWRGADPITFSVLSGQPQTGVSLMLIVEKMDEGPLLAVGMQDIEPDMTTPALTQKLIYLSDGLLRMEIPRYLTGESTGVDQAAMSGLIPDYPEHPTYSRKLTKADGTLDFTKPVEQLEREVRAYAGWPGSRTTLAGKDVVVTKAHVLETTSGTQDSKLEVGKAYVNNKELHVPTHNGILVIDALKPAGKNEMPAAAFLAGYGKNL
jgi:methionyl-tRNA formyltransferase